MVFSLDSNVKQVYFRSDPQIECVIILANKRQLNRKDLNLMDPNLSPVKELPKFDKIWLKFEESTNLLPLVQFLSHFEKVKVHHESKTSLSEIFLLVRAPTNPDQFYGSSKDSTSSSLSSKKEVISSLLNARKEREELISTGPRTRYRTSLSSESENGSSPSTSTGSSSKFDDGSLENINEADQIRFYPDLNFKFEDKRNFTITNSDFKCLYNNLWINDTLIDFFLKLSVETSTKLNDWDSHKVLLLNSFFFTKLVTGENNYENVKSWFKDDSLFRHKYVIIPVNQDFHWYCIIIYNLDLVYEDLQSEVKEVTNGENRIEIYVLDSLSQTHRSVRQPLVNFLTDYAKERYNLTLEKDDFRMYASPIPRQQNFNDCGIHVIYNINIFLNKMDEFQEIWKIPRKKYRNNRKLFLIEDRQNMRLKLREKLIQLLRDQEKRSGNENYDKIGKMTNKDFKADKLIDSHKEEDDDSDFEIIEDNSPPENNGKDEAKPEGEEVKAEVGHDEEFDLEADKVEEANKAATDGDEGTDRINNDHEQVQGKEEGLPTDETSAQILSDDSMSISDELEKISFESFYLFLTDEKPISNQSLGKFRDFVKSKRSQKFATRLISYLGKFEPGILTEEIFENDTIMIIKYFNNLNDSEMPDREVVESYYSAFIDCMEDGQDVSMTGDVSKDETPIEVSDEELDNSQHRAKFMSNFSSDELVETGRSNMSITRLLQAQRLRQQNKKRKTE